MNAQEKLNELKKQGITVYSHSRLSTKHTCEYEYFNTYIARIRGIDNIYSLMGTLIHESLENIYSGNGTREKFIDDYKNKLLELEMLDVKFPNEKIKDSWLADMDHFLKNFKKLNTKMIQEQLIVFEIEDGIWMQGLIDAIVPSQKGKPYVNIIDWKTSSKFSGKKLDEAGRQLLLYKLGLETITNLKVDKVMWGMLKYVNVCWKLKNGKTKEKMCNRGKWVKEIKPQLERELHNLNMENFEIELLLERSIKENKLDYLPKEIQQKYWLEDCYVEYEVTDKKIKDFKKYVIDTVREIESKDVNNEDEWKGIELNKYNSFYCSNLCGHRKHCKYYKSFLDENADSFKNKEKKDEFSFDNLFG